MNVVGILRQRSRTHAFGMAIGSCESVFPDIAWAASELYY